MKKTLFGFLVFATALNISAQVNETAVYQNLARDIFKELIEINTTFRYGSTKLQRRWQPGSDLQDFLTTIFR